MLKNLIISTIALLIFLPHCSPPIKYRSLPPQAGSFSLLMAKIFFRNDQFKFSGKILLSFDQEKDKILFLSPMNQVYFKLLVKNEHAILVNMKKKRYWQGPFHILFSKMAKIDIHYQEMKELILRGTTPTSSRNYSVSIKERTQGGEPQHIIIEGQQLLVRFKIRSLKTREGKIHFKINKNRLTQSNLRKTLTVDR